MPNCCRRKLPKQVQPLHTFQFPETMRVCILTCRGCDANPLLIPCQKEAPPLREQIIFCPTTICRRYFVSALTKAGHYFGRLALEPYLLIKVTSVGIILIVSAHLRCTLPLPVSNDYKEGSGSFTTISR